MADRVESSRDRPKPRSRGVIWAGVSVLLAVAISLLLLFAPLGRSVSTSAERPSRPGTSEHARTVESGHNLLATEGWRVAGVMLIPVAACAAPLLVPRRARRPVAAGSAVLLGVAVVIGSASIGLFYLPVVATMVIAASTLPGKPLSS
jgi:hypothetical protein